MSCSGNEIKFVETESDDLIVFIKDYAYIEAHIDEIRNHASTIEKRLYDTDYTIESLKFDNKYYIDAFTQSGEQITMIDTDYWQTVEELLEQ